MRAQLASWKPAAAAAVASLGTAFGHDLPDLFGQPTITAGQVFGWRLSWHPRDQ